MMYPRRRRISKYILGVFIFCLLPYRLLNWVHSSNPHHKIPSTRVPHQDWQPVLGSKHRFAIYSAYCLVNRTSPEVLLIGVTNGDSQEDIRCHFHFPNQQNQSTEVVWMDYGLHINSLPIHHRIFERIKHLSKLEAKRRMGMDQALGSKEVLLPGYTRKYAGVFVKCHIPPGPVRPEAVSLLLNRNTNLTNRVRIQYLDESEDAPYQYNFSVCVKPLFNFNKVLPLLEWIEFYKLMGVEQFTFYNMSIGPEASCILNALVSGSDSSIKVNVLPWRNHKLLDESGDGGTSQPSQGAAQQECVYRHRGRRSKYMIFADLDEFIMPRENVSTNYRELMSLLDSQAGGSKIGEYIFQNAFFVLSRPDQPLLLEWCSRFRGFWGDPLRYRICTESVMMQKTLREADLYDHGVRSKFIIKPEGVQIVSAHFIERFEEGYVGLDVPGSIAINRHYREFEEGSRTTEDGISKEFGQKLVRGLSRSVEPFMEMCNLKLKDLIGQ